jgi:hypothetical protein
MPKYATYNSTESVKAYQVTEADGVDIVTSVGSVHAGKGDYVVQLGDDSEQVVPAESFEARYKGTATRKATSTRKSTAKPRKGAAKRS